MGQNRADIFVVVGANKPKTKSIVLSDLKEITATISGQKDKPAVTIGVDVANTKKQMTLDLNNIVERLKVKGVALKFESILPSKPVDVKINASSIANQVKQAINNTPVSIANVSTDKVNKIVQDINTKIWETIANNEKYSDYNIDETSNRANSQSDDRNTSTQPYNVDLQKGTYLEQTKIDDATYEKYTEHVKQYNKAVKESSIAHKAAAAGKKALSVGWNMVGMAMASFAIEKLIHFTADLINADKIAIEKANELTDAYNKQKKQFTDNIQSLNGMSDEFDRLSNGVSDYGENVSLSTDEYSRYKEMISQITSISPSLITSYDNEGDAIAKKNGLIEESIRLEQKKLELERKKRITPENLFITAKGDNADYKQKQGVVLNTQQTFHSVLSDIINTSFSGGNLSNDEETKIRDKITSGLGNINSKNSYEQGNGVVETYDISTVADATHLYGMLANMSDVFTTDTLQPLKDFIDELNTGVEDVTDNVYTELRQAFKEVAMDVEKYDTMGNDTKNFISDWINNLEITPEIANNESAMSKMKKNVVKFTKKLTDNPDAQENIKNLFLLDKQNLPYAEWKSQAESLKNTIVKNMGLSDNDEFVINFKSKLLDDEIQIIDAEMKNVTSKQIESLTDRQIRILYSIEDKGNMTFKEAIAAIEEIQKTSKKPTTNFSNLTNISTAIKNIQSLGSAYNDFTDDGILTTATLLELQATFKATDKQLTALNAAFVNGDKKAVQSELEGIASSYLYSAASASNLTEAQKKQIVAELDSLGVKNSLAVLNDCIANSERNAAIEKFNAELATIDFTNATLKQIDSLITEAKQLDVNAYKLANYEKIKTLAAQKESKQKAYTNMPYGSAEIQKARLAELAQMDAEMRTLASDIKPIDVKPIKTLKIDWDSLLASQKGSTDELEKQKNLLQEQKSLVEKQKGDVESLLNLTLSMLKQEYDDKKKILQLELDGYKKKIDNQLSLLKLKETERDYQRDLTDKVDNVAEIQGDLLRLQGDDSFEAQKQRLELEDQLANATDELNEFQHDKEISRQEEALNTELERFTEFQNNKIQAIDDYVAVENNLRQEAYALIEGRSQEFYDRLVQYNTMYQDGVTQNVINIWNNAYTALEQFNYQQVGVLRVLNLMAIQMSDFDTQINKAKESSDALASSLSKARDGLGGVKNGVDEVNRSLESLSKSPYASQGEMHTAYKDSTMGAWANAYQQTLNQIPTFSTSAPRKFKTGGVADYTGIAQLDGTSTAPEVIFNANDSRKLFDYVTSTPNLVSDMIAKTMNKLGTMAMPSSSSINNIANSNPINVNLGGVNFNGNSNDITPNDLNNFGKQIASTVFDKLNRQRNGIGNKNYEFSGV